MKRFLTFALLLVFAGVLGYEALIWVDNYFPFGRMRETPAVRPHEEALLVMPSGIVPFAGGEELFMATPVQDLKAPFDMNDPAAVEKGGRLYLTYCAQCHGIHHDGNGTVGQSFAPLPTDLRSQKVQALPEGLHFKEISFGVPDGRQPALATTIEATDRWRIVAYVKSLGLRK